MPIDNLCAPENFGVSLWAVFGPWRAPSIACVKFILSNGVGPCVKSVHGGALPGMTAMFGAHLPKLASEWAKQQGAVYLRDHGAALDCIRERTAAPPPQEASARRDADGDIR